MQIDRRLGGWILTYFALAALVVFVASKPKKSGEPRRIEASARVESSRATLRKVIDGDTVDLWVREGAELRVRLFGIDAPERGQPFFDDAKRKLENLLRNEPLNFVSKNKDRYGRTVGILFIGETNVCIEMVRSGFAWHFRQYSSDPEFSAAEEAARENRRGMWEEANTLVPPWEFRKVHRN